MIDLVLKREYQKDKLVFIVPEDDFTRVLLTGVLTKCKQKHGDYVQVSISTPKRKRSNEQNRHLHGHCQQIAQETGNDLQDIKDYVKERAVRMGYPTRTNKMSGAVTPLSSADVSTVELGYLIEELHILAGDLGIILKEGFE